MTSQEDHVLGMVRAGTISEAEGQRLLGALQARRRDLPGIQALYRPMDFLSTRGTWVAAIAVTVATLLVTRLGIRFDGALDLHQAIRTPRWSTALLDVANGVLVTGGVLWLVSLAVTRSVRLVDVVLAVAIARVAIVFGAIAAWLVLPDARVVREAVLAALTKNAPMDPSLMFASLLLPPFLVWFIVLLYQGFRSSTGLQGPRAGIAFALGIFVAEAVTKAVLMTASSG